MSCVSKSEWNIMGKCPASGLKVSRDDVMDVEYKEYIPYIQQYIVATSNNSRA